LKDRVNGKGGNNMRTKATIDRLNMYKNFKAVRNRSGKIIKAAPNQGKFVFKNSNQLYQFLRSLELKLLKFFDSKAFFFIFYS
jgi:hypothetical protein